MGASTSASASAKSVAGLPGPVACQRLTDGPWRSFRVAAVIASAIGKTPASEPRCVAIAPHASRLTDAPWQAFTSAGVNGFIFVFRANVVWLLDAGTEVVNRFGLCYIIEYIDFTEIDFPT